MKKITILIIIALLLLFVSFLYFSKYSEKAKIGEENRNSIKLIQIGMNLKDVNEIMGSTDTIYYIQMDRESQCFKKVHSYYRGPGKYGYLQVIFDPEADTVLEVINIIE